MNDQGEDNLNMIDDILNKIISNIELPDDQNVTETTEILGDPNTGNFSKRVTKEGSGFRAVTTINVRLVEDDDDDVSIDQPDQAVTLQVSHMQDDISLLE